MSSKICLPSQQWQKNMIKKYSYTLNCKCPDQNVHVFMLADVLGHVKLAYVLRQFCHEDSHKGSDIKLVYAAVLLEQIDRTLI